jgi:peptide/nickel transport system permease protein
MSRILIARLGDSLLAVWGIVTIVFIVTHLLGDPAVLLLPLDAPRALITALRANLGLDRPIAVQYADFLWHAIQGDFGESFQQGRPAMTVVLERMPATLTLASAAIGLGVIIGGVAGGIAAVMRGTLAELLVMVGALIGQATPVFWLGLMLILFFAVNLGWLPSGGYGTGASLVLPAFTLATFVSASIARLFRSSLLDNSREDHVRTAHAKGLSPFAVFTWHVARNALIPVVTMIGIAVGELLGGSVVTETVFSWPGVGRAVIQAIEYRDFPVVQAGVTLIATIYVAVNFGVDLIYAALDPRIRQKP